MSINTFNLHSSAKLQRKESIMIFKPNVYFSTVQDITIEFLMKNKIKALILDVDNTLIDYDKNLAEETLIWAKQLQGQGIKMYILSNTNKQEKVEIVAKKIEIPYEYFAKKPSKSGFLKVKQILKMKEENIAVVGDQIFTDVIGGNRCKMFTILVDPVTEKDYWYTAWKRPIEDIFKSRLEKGRVYLD